MHATSAMLPLPSRYRFISLASTAEEAEHRPQVSLPSPDHAAWQPERRLMLAILQEAVDTLIENRRCHDGRAHRLYLDAAAWIAADDEESPFAFVSVCDALRLDVGRMRQWISGRVDGFVLGGTF